VKNHIIAGALILNAASYGFELQAKCGGKGERVDNGTGYGAMHFCAAAVLLGCD